VTSLTHHALDRLWTLLAPRGRHRAPRPGPYAVDTPIDGRATAMARPYLLAPAYGMEFVR
jgi:hypothetical protein